MWSDNESKRFLNNLSDNYLKKKLLKFFKYIIKNSLVIITIILIYIYIDAYYYAEDKLAKILLNKIKGRNYTWWKPYNWWEL